MPDSLRHLDTLTPVPKGAPERPPIGYTKAVEGAAPSALGHARPAARDPLDGSGRKQPGEMVPEAPPGYPPGYPAAYAGQLQGGEVHLLDYVRVLYRRRYTAVSAFVLVVTAVVVYTFTQTPIFQARTQLLIEPDNPNVVSFKEVVENDKSNTDYYQTQYKMLQSRALARRTLDAAALWNHPLFAGTGAAAKGVAQSSPAPATAGQPAPETAAQSRAIDAFLSRLTVSPIRNSRLVDVKFDSPDAELSARVANTLARAYIDQNMEFRFLSSKEASDWLGQRLSEQRQQVEASEQALQKYREQTDSVSLEDKQNIVVQRLADLNAAVTKAKTERLQKEAAYNQVRAIEHDRAALDTFPAILANPFIQQLKGQLADLQRQQASLGEKYGEKHPEMVKLRTQIEQADAKLRGEIGKVVQSIRNEYEAAQEQERGLVTALEQQKGEAMSLSRKGINYGVLQRDATTNREMFNSIMQRAKETGVSAELKTSNIRVVDAAEVPRVPITPRKSLNLLLALFGGGLFAAGLAFFFEYLDNRIKSPEEIKHVLGLPFLGLVPFLKEGDSTPENALLHNSVPSGFAEAFRTIRTSVLFSSAEEGGRSVVVTSTGPGEGKTLVSTNLAVALAQAGQRVLLVDGDMRKPRVHQVFDQKVEPGLSNVLVGNSKASDAVRKGPVANLYLLVAGVTPPNPAELLASQRFRDFLHTLQEHFDWVIVDAPPVMAVTDASVVAHLAHGVIFVVGCEQTNRHTATAALEQLESAKAKFLGGILNKVDVDRNSDLLLALLPEGVRAVPTTRSAPSGSSAGRSIPPRPDATHAAFPRCDTRRPLTTSPWSPPRRPPVRASSISRWATGGWLSLPSISR